MVKRLHIIFTGEVPEATTVDVEHLSEQTPTEQNVSQEGPPKKVRGYTRKQAIWDLESNERIVVTFDETGQPVGDEANEFTSFLGTLVKMSQHVSIEGLYWKKISEDKKEDLWNIIKGKFSVDQAETKAIRKWVMSDMASKLKSWKYELKRNSYDPTLSIDEIVAA